MKAALKRSLFQTVPAKHFVAALSTAVGGRAWRPNADILKHIEARSKTIIASSLVEECHNFQKNNSQSRGSSKFRRPERSMAV